MTQIKIPLNDLYACHQPIEQEILEKIREMIASSSFIGGAEVTLFEAAFSRFCAMPFTAACANGTDALVLLLKAAGVHEGDTVITVPNTFIATAEAVSSLGAEVAFVDADPDYFTMNPHALASYCEQHHTKKKIKAVIPVHLYGQMADMPAIAAIAENYNISVIEDAAQAHGALLENKSPGSFGCGATYSFYPGKNLGAMGDAGAITTHDATLYQTIKMMIDHGRLNEKYLHRIVGFNKRMDTIQAAILRIKLRYLQSWNNARIRKAALYTTLLQNAPVTLPEVRENATHVFHQYVIRTKQREKLMQRLAENSIATGIHYPVPLHLQPAYAALGYTKGDFPVAEMLAEEVLSLPLYPELSDDAIELIAGIICKSV